MLYSKSQPEWFEFEWAMAKLLVYKGPVQAEFGNQVSHPFWYQSQFYENFIFMVYISSKEVYLTYAIDIVARKGQEKHGGECTKVLKG